MAFEGLKKMLNPNEEEEEYEEVKETIKGNKPGIFIKYLYGISIMFLNVVIL